MSRERIMLTQAIPAVQQLRRVQGFDPLRFLKRNVNGGIELEPRYQRLWFRLACPDGKMLLNRLQITDQIAVYEAQVFLSREDSLLCSDPPNARLRVCECCLRHLHVFSPFSPPVPPDGRCVLLPPVRRSRARLPPALSPCPTPA